MLPPTPRQLDAENRKPTKNGIWPYHDENGKIFEVRVRYDTADGKEVMPWHFTKDGKWVNRQAPGLRPLYRLTELRNNPEMPVVFVEGEKTADRAAVIFGDHIATTSSGGSKAHAATNYAHLKGRDVVIWPDQDKVGGTYAQTVAQHLHTAGANTIRIVDVPQDWPEGWDLADEPPTDSTDLRGMLDSALPWASKPATSTLNGHAKPTIEIALDILNEFQRDEHDRLYKNEHNVLVAFAKSSVRVSYDEFAHEYKIEGLPGYGPALNDDALDEL